jgi:hypothetical protein
MGGSIAITFRDESGKVEKMCRWTNIMPDFLVNHKLYAKDKKFIAEFLKEWKVMKKDWDDNEKRKVKKYKYPMTPAYADYRLLAPIDYGLVVVDLKTNNILSMQGYCSLTTHYLSIRPIQEETEVFDELLKHGHVVDFQEHFYKYSKWTAGLTFKQTLDAILDVRERVKKGETIYGSSNDILHSMPYLEINPAPFKVRDYDENIKGLRKMKKDIEALGFELTEEDTRQWENTIKQRREDGYED